jgi:hypothetical protein
MEAAGAVAAAEGAICRRVHRLGSGDEMRWGTYEEERFAVGSGMQEQESLNATVCG